MVKYGLLYRPAVTPLPRVLRQASTLFLVASVAAMLALTALGAPALAQGDAGAGNDTATSGSLPPLATGKTARTITLGSFSASAPECGGKANCWDQEIVLAKPGERVTMIADLRDDDTPHTLKVAIDGATPTETDSADEVQTVDFVVPDSFERPIPFVCGLHAEMTGQIVPYEDYQAALAGESGVIDVPHLGVNFLAYWVGLIAFAILFIVYGITFFLFKYNETPATTDHWDRTGAGAPDAGRRMGGGSAMLVAILIAIVVLAAIIWLARR